MRGLFLSLSLAVPAQAGPLFVDRAGDLPVAHVYDGGWEHNTMAGYGTYLWCVHCVLCEEMNRVG